MTITRVAIGAMLVALAGCSAKIQDDSEGAAALQGLSQFAGLITVGGTQLSCSPDYPWLCADEAMGSRYVPLGNGEALIAGSFVGDVHVGAFTLSSKGCDLYCPYGFPSSDVFVAHVDHNDHVTWARAFGSTNNDWLYDVQVDAADNIYIAGTFAMPIELGQFTLATHGSVDWFVSKLDPVGEPQWAVGAGSSKYDYPHGLTLLGDDVIVVGSVSGPWASGQSSAPGFGDWDVGMARLSRANGAVVSMVTAGGPGGDVGRAVLARSDGSVLVAGAFSGTADLFGQSFQSAGGTDAFVARVSATGSAHWVRPFSGPGNALVESIAVDHHKGLLVAGSFESLLSVGPNVIASAGDNDGFVAGVDGQGLVHWATRMGGNGEDTARSLMRDLAGQIFVTGAFSDVAQFGAGSLSSAGGTDVFLARIHKEGPVTWAIRAGGPADDSALSVRVLPNHTWHVAGSFAGTASFGTFAPTSFGVGDAFFWRGKTVPGQENRWNP